MNRVSPLALAVVAGFWLCTPVAAQKDFKLQLRYQQESSPDSGRFHVLQKAESWKPAETAIIVCDVWDLHHCLNAVRRLEQFAPRLNDVLATARGEGVTIIHSPSDCMDAYKNHPARNRALETPSAGRTPHDVKAWCSIVPAEERAVYPVDQSDGGEDDDPREHAKWAAKLKSMGRNPGTPWGKQSKLITIDPKLDYISDRGDEVWNILEQRGIRNVILTGVHTNMCVLGRPFGLRQMARNGKNVVLMRDMTDTMYNPQRWPYVSHFTGTDRIIAHIERYVCPTITSDQFLGGKPFRLKKDTRPHLVIVMAEDEYETNRTLPKFAKEQLGHHFRVTMLFGSDDERNSIPGLEVLDDADMLLVSIRRRVLPVEDMARFRRFVQAGKPVVGIRTASHAFALRKGKPPEGFADWPEFDAQVFGGNYDGHHGNKLKATVSLAASADDHPITARLTKEKFPQGGSLYEPSPLEAGAHVLLTGSVEGKPAEPVAWTFKRDDGGRSFYTSLGHKDDFENPEFVRLFFDALCWAADIPSSTKNVTPSLADFQRHWSAMPVPAAWEAASGGALQDYDGVGWYRCVVRIPSPWADGLSLKIAPLDDDVKVWCNGHELAARKAAAGKELHFPITNKSLVVDDANLLVVQVTDRGGEGGLRQAPVLFGNVGELKLAGRWQFRTGDDATYANMPLPAKFGAATDIVFSPPEPLWSARPLTRPGEFTPGIEGPACDAEGNVYAVNFAHQGTIGRVRPDGVGEVFVELPGGSIGNGIRFDRDGFFFVADYAGHNILKVDPKTREITQLAHHDGMNQPNDLAIAPDGTLYASDPAWAKGTGQLWRIDPDGTVTRVAEDMGTTNGIEVSPDGGTLYVNESVQRNVFAFTISKDRTLKDKRLVRKFEDHGFDGMRCDVDGNLYITRYGKGTVVKMSPAGKILEEIDVLGPRPSNICFGGPDGRTAYVTEVESTRLVSFRVDRPGRSWQEQQKK